jgi:hypothetical protein
MAAGKLAGENVCQSDGSDKDKIPISHIGKLNGSTS